MYIAESNAIVLKFSDRLSKLMGEEIGLRIGRAALLMKHMVKCVVSSLRCICCVNGDFFECFGSIFGFGFGFTPWSPFRMVFGV